jgi:sec-independent protein translocase protein TatC
MLIAMAPLVVLYELSLILAKVFEPKGEPRFGFLEGWGEDDEDDEGDEAPDDGLDEHPDAPAYTPDGGGARGSDELD